MNKEDVIEYIKRLSEPELAGLILSALECRKKIYGEDVDDAYCLVNSGYYKYDGEHTTEFLALPIEWPNIDLTDIKINSFSGKCEKCHVVVSCVGITAICPICSNHVECN